MEAITVTIKLQLYLLTVPSMSAGDINMNIHDEITSKHTVESAQFNLTEMLIKLVEKIEHLEWKLSGNEGTRYCPR